MWACLEGDGKKGEQASVTSSPNGLQGVSGQGEKKSSRGRGEPEEDPVCANMCMCVHACVKALLSA